MLELAASEGSLEGVVARQLPLLLHPSRVPPGWAADSDRAPQTVDRHRFPEAAAVLAMARETPLPAFAAQQEAIISRTDARAALHAYAGRPAAPRVLVLCGTEDALIPRRAADEMFQSAAVGDVPAAAAAGHHWHHGDHRAPQAHLHASARHHHGHSPAHPPARAAHRPNVTFAAVAGAGHLVTLEAPGAVTEALLRWMED